MSWPVSARRTSSSDWARAGTRISPGHELRRTISSVRLACWVSVIGRECGAAIGTEPIATTSRTSRRSTTWRTARAKPSQRVSGSGPVSMRYGRSRLSRISRTTRRGAS